MSDPPDTPSGRRALFGEPVVPAGGGDEGRRAFFSAGAPGRRPPRGTVRVTCQSCGRGADVGVLRLARLLVPSLWLPRGRYSRLMRCPACRQFTWCAVDWWDLNPLR